MQNYILDEKIDFLKENLKKETSSSKIEAFKKSFLKKNKYGFITLGLLVGLGVAVNLYSHTLVSKEDIQRNITPYLQTTKMLKTICNIASQDKNSQLIPQKGLEDLLDKASIQLGKGEVKEYAQETLKLRKRIDKYSSYSFHLDSTQKEEVLCSFSSDASQLVSKVDSISQERVNLIGTSLVAIGFSQFILGGFFSFRNIRKQEKENYNMAASSLERFSSIEKEDTLDYLYSIVSHDKNQLNIYSLVSFLEGVKHEPSYSSSLREVSQDLNKYSSLLEIQKEFSRGVYYK